MSRVRLHQMALLMAGLMLATGAVAGEEAKKPAAPPTGFYKKFFAPQMESKLGGDLDAAVEFVNRDANPWTRNDDTVTRVQRNAISATKRALKRYAIESFHMDTWALPLFKGASSGSGEAGSAPRSAHLRFGISHMRPRAEVLITAAHGRVLVSADARGAVATSFESPTSDVRLSVTFDVPAHAATFTLNRRF